MSKLLVQQYLNQLRDLRKLSGTCRGTANQKNEGQ